MTHTLEILWQQYVGGRVVYAVAVPGARLVWRRWLWQAKLDRARIVRSLGAVVVAHGIADPEPWHGGFL